MLHFYKNHNPDRTVKILQLVNERYGTTIEYKEFHIDDFNNWYELKNI